MKWTALFTLPIYIVFAFTGVAKAQKIITDSSRNYIEVDGKFNGAQVNLPAVKKLPAFKGGKKAWHDFLRSQINSTVPLINRAIPGVYTVMVRYVVGMDGKLQFVAADSNCGYGMENEVIRCIKKSPDWIPAETSIGEKVGLALRTIITFTVKRNDVVISFS